jgi:hypothetical protein
MKRLSRKRAPKNLPTAVSDLVAEGGNILASDDATVLAVAPTAAVEETSTPSGAKPHSSRTTASTAATL